MVQREEEKRLSLLAGVRAGTPEPFQSMVESAPANGEVEVLQNSRQRAGHGLYRASDPPRGGGDRYQHSD